MERKTAEQLARDMKNNPALIQEVKSQGKKDLKEFYNICRDEALEESVSEALFNLPLNGFASRVS